MLALLVGVPSVADSVAEAKESMKEKAVVGAVKAPKRAAAAAEPGKSRKPDRAKRTDRGTVKRRVVETPSKRTPAAAEPIAGPSPAVPTPAPAVQSPPGDAPARRSGRPKAERQGSGTGRSAPDRATLRRAPADVDHRTALLQSAARGASSSLSRRAAFPRPARPLRPPAAERESGLVAPLTRTVREIVEVVPAPVKGLLAALAAMSMVLGGGYLLTSARARRLARQRADLLQEVGLLQTALLPPVPATVGALRTSVAYRPSDGPAAGGDFYDALALPGGRAGFILGDVSGHGRRALAQTAFMRYTLRAYLEAGLEPRPATCRAVRVIDEHLDGDFATVVLAIHDPAAGSLTYACAGHPAPIIVGSTRAEPVLAAGSPPIGLGLRTGLRQTTVPLPPGSVVCFYTDGLAEARTEKGILGRPRLADILAGFGRDATAAMLLDHVTDEATRVTDDMAAVVLTPTTGVTAGGFRAEQLEVDATEISQGLPKRFLQACGVDAERVAAAEVEIAALSKHHAEAVVGVRYGMPGPQVEVLPRNVESLEAASFRAAARAR